MKKPAHRGATAGLSKCVRQDRNERYASATAALQARNLSHRYGLSDAVAAVVAGHLYSVPEHWSARA